MTATPMPALAPPQEENPFRYGWRFVKELRDDGSEELVQVPLTLEDALHPQEEDHISERYLQAVERCYLADVFRSRLGRMSGGQVLSDQLVDWNVPGQRDTAPDVAVFREVQHLMPPQSGTFHLADAGGRCVLAIELVSPDTRNNDVVHKYAEYYRAQVPLYVIVDQVRDGAPRQLLGYLHTSGGYRQIPLDAQGRLLVSDLGLRLGLRDEQIYCYDVQTGKELGDYTHVVQELDAKTQALAEAEEARRLAEDRARLATAARQTAEERVQELEAEIRRLRGQPPTP